MKRKGRRGKRGKRRGRGDGLAVNVEEATAFVVAASRRTGGGFGGGASLRFAFGDGSAAFQLDADAATGRDFLRVLKFFERKTRFRFGFSVPTSAGGDALGREDKRVVGDVHGVSPARFVINII